MSNQLFSYWGNQTKNILQHLEVIQKVIFIRFLDKVELSLSAVYYTGLDFTFGLSTNSGFSKDHVD